MPKTIVLFLSILLVCLASACDFKFGMGLSDQSKANLADCLTAKGTKLYVTTWCGACKNQRAIFGAAAAKLDIVQCDAPSDPTYDHPECVKNKIEYVPTWIFRDGRRLVGCQELRTLAKYSGCQVR